MPGSVFALEERALVPGDAEPVETVQDDAGVLLRAALAVGVLDPKHVDAAGVSGIEPVEQRGAGAADVEVTGRGGSEADSGFRHVRSETEREGFEPSIEVDPLCRFSKPVPSATRPPLQRPGEIRGVVQLRQVLAAISSMQRPGSTRGLA